MIDRCCPIQYQIHLRVPLFIYGLILSLLYNVYLFLISTHKALKFIDLIILYSAYTSFSLLAFYLKDYLADNTCSIHPNSVSGHTFFNFFFFTNYLIRFFSLGKSKTLFHIIFLFTVETLFMVNSSLTYLGGYHSPRQMIYGAILSAFVVIFYNIFKSLFNRRTNLLFYTINLLIWIFISAQFSSVTRKFSLVLLPAIFNFLLCVLAYYIEKREIQKLE